MRVMEKKNLQKRKISDYLYKTFILTNNIVCTKKLFFTFVTSKKTDILNYQNHSNDP